MPGALKQEGEGVGGFIFPAVRQIKVVARPHPPGGCDFPPLPQTAE